ncbi:MAG: GNAT family N-acetyltransferase [Chloroflexi bacterium]|nr:GNAT family N-acetyltransferase [Chloroflexota bacterium]
MGDIRYILMEPGQETAVGELVARVFGECIAPLYSAEGIEEFLKYPRPELLLRRSQMDHFVLLAWSADEVVGMIEMRDYHHVALFFVDTRCQHRGIGKQLLHRSLEICLRPRPDLRAVSVNASPNSVAVYRTLGFRETSSEQVANGIRFTPMVLELPKAGWT